MYICIMKKLLFIIVLLLSIECSAQEKKGVFIDNKLVGLVDEYIVEAKKRNIDVVPFLMTMDNIIMSDKIQYPLLGIATKDRKNVFIGEYCAIEPIILKVTLFHELTHAIFNTDHFGCYKYSIMNESTPESFYVYKDNALWEKMLDEMFSVEKSNKTMKKKKG